EAAVEAKAGSAPKKGSSKDVKKPSSKKDGAQGPAEKGGAAAQSAKAPTKKDGAAEQGAEGKSTGAKKSAQKQDKKADAIKPAEVPAGPAWLNTDPIQALLERGKEQGSLDTEEISDAFRRAVESLDLEPEEQNFEDLMEVLEKRGILVA